MKNKLSTFEAISIIIIVMIAQIILDFPEYLIDITGSGTIINIIFLSIISLIYCIIISKFFKNFANQDIIDISEFIGGRFLKFIIASIFIIFLLISIIVAISNFLYLLRTIYFQYTHPLFIFSIFIITILATSQLDFNSIKKNASVFTGILILSIILLLFGDNGNFNSNNLIPFFGYNYKTTFQTGLSNIFIFDWG